MFETAAMVEKDGMVHVLIPGGVPGTRVKIVVLANEPEHRTADSNPDVEDFA